METTAQRALIADHEQLAIRAARNWPDSAYAQAEWIRAIGVLRCTRMGWLLERHLDPLRKANPNEKASY